MTYSTPLYGIPVPDGTSLAKNLPAELKAMGEGFEAALNAHVAIPVSNAAVVTATSEAARDSYWGTPTTETARLTLQARGATTIRTDKNITERYFATYNATTNPQGMTPAGWYPIGAPSSLIPTTRSAAERNAIFGTPSTSTTQLELQNRGARTYRSDLGLTEQYFGVFNATTNPGGRDTAGWYSIDRQRGLVPIRPANVTYTGNSLSVNALGQISGLSITNMNIMGVFTGEFRNYLVLVSGYKTGATANNFVSARVMIGSAVATSAAYESGAVGFDCNSGALQNLGGGGATYWLINRIYDNACFFSTEFNIYSPYVLNENTRISGGGVGRTASVSQQVVLGGVHWSGAVYDGINIFSTGNATNINVQIFGYND